jgi:hypothetical protein
MMLPTKEGGRDNKRHTTLPDAKWFVPLNHIWGTDRISDDQEFHPVSKELLKGAGPFEFFSERVCFQNHSFLFVPHWKYLKTQGLIGRSRLKF